MSEPRPIPPMTIVVTFTDPADGVHPVDGLLGFSADTDPMIIRLDRGTIKRRLKTTISLVTRQCMEIHVARARSAYKTDRKAQS